MGKNHPVREDPPAPALTVHWAVTAATRRPARHKPTADKVQLFYINTFLFYVLWHFPCCSLYRKRINFTFLSDMWYISISNIDPADNHKNTRNTRLPSHSWHNSTDNDQYVNSSNKLSLKALSLSLALYPCSSLPVFDVSFAVVSNITQISSQSVISPAFHWIQCAH